MSKKDKLLKELFKELPQDKAPEGITQLIMNKIEEREAVLSSKNKIYFWQTQAFYIMIAIVLAESWLLYNVREWLTVSTFVEMLRSAYIAAVEYVATYNFSLIITILAIMGVFIYLFVRERIENAKCCMSRYF